MPRAAIPIDLRAHIRELDQGRCAYCHTPESLTVVTFEIDHIVPQSTGGETHADNLCLACPSCNRHKGARRRVLLPTAEQSVPLYHPRHQLWSDHFAWNDDGTLLVGMTSVGSVTTEALHINRPQMVRLRALWRSAGLWP